MALPIVPDFVREGSGRRRRIFRRHQSLCVLRRCCGRSAKIRGMSDCRERDRGGHCAVCVALMPLKRGSCRSVTGSAFEDAPQPVHDGMAAGIRSVLGRMNRALGNPPHTTLSSTVRRSARGRGPRLSLARASRLFRGCVAHRRFRVGNRVFTSTRRLRRTAAARLRAAT